MKKIISLLVVLAVLVLELLPYGAVLNFLSPVGENWSETYAYFSLTPFGYANFGPLLTAVISCVLLLFVLLSLLVKGKDFSKAIRAVSLLGVLTSLMPLLFGISFYTVTGFFISALLVTEAVLSFLKD